MGLIPSTFSNNHPVISLQEFEMREYFCKSRSVDSHSGWYLLFHERLKVLPVLNKSS